jgi:threonine synthase
MADLAPRFSYLESLKCSACGERCDADTVEGTCPACGLVLFATYDLDALGRDMPQPSFEHRPWDLWRYHELLPVRDPANVHGLGEGATPLLNVPKTVTDAVGLTAGELLIKDEGRNPTASFKARGMAVAVSRAAELGIGEVALPSAGNAGGAAAAYAAAAGLGCHVAMPRDVPEVNRLEAEAFGAEVVLVDGLIDLAGTVVRERGASEGWFDLSTLREPYRAEGKKTMGYELAEAGGWGDGWCPDVLVFPTGGGTAIVGMWKAFAELEQLGWIGSRRPRMVVVQAEGCAPLVRAFEQGAERAEPWIDAHTIAAGIRVPSGIGDYLVLRAVRESGGTAVAVTDDEILAAQRLLAHKAGIYAAFEGAAAFAALPHLAETGFVSPTERVVVFNTAMGIKS